MTIILDADGTVTNPQGFQVGTATCGIKSSGNLDLMLLHSTQNCTAAGMFTTNQVVGAPVTVNRETLTSNSTNIRAIVANSGIANACTGSQGLNNAIKMQDITSKSLNCDPNQVLVLSTGVIGIQLPMKQIDKGIRTASSNLSHNSGCDGAEAIMTTDTNPKYCALEVELPTGTFTIGGIAKGAGMVHPNMATMLACITTDAKVPESILRSSLITAVNKSFNRISIDGDTSTSDSVLIMANSVSGISCEQGNYRKAFTTALTCLATNLAKQIVRDGEGVNKFVTIHVSGAPSVKAAHIIANSIATSPLVKTAFAGSDPNWGRIVVAAGKSGVQFDPSKTQLWIGSKIEDELQLVKKATPCDYDEDVAQRIFSQPEFHVHLDLGNGKSEISVWTGDLTEEYVRINSDYRT
jgi:glutamate N-acetyltransferase/amino-acid N-acetyltransferase